MSIRLLSGGGGGRRGGFPSSGGGGTSHTPVYLGTVANQATMLALVGSVSDWCNRSDTLQTFTCVALPMTVLTNWVPNASPKGLTGPINFTS